MRLLSSLLLLLSILTNSPAAEPRLVPDLVYSTLGKRELHLDLCLPTATNPTPLVVWIHGGGWHAGSYKESADGMAGFANLGIASASVEYRLAQEARFPAQRDDLHAALRYLVQIAPRYNFDPRRVILLGGSAGGHLALLMGFDPKPAAGMMIRGIINLDGPTHLGMFPTDPLGDAELKSSGSTMGARELVADFLGTSDRSATIYAEASPLTWVRPGVPPVLTLHGSDDHIVPFSQAEALHAALRHFGVEEKLLRGAGGGHTLESWPKADKDQAILAMRDFLMAHLLTK